MKTQVVSDIEVLNNSFLTSNPKLILEHSINNLFKNKIVYVCSFGTESAIILDLISKIDKSLPIIMLNTHFLFEETIRYKNELLKLLGLKNYREVFPDETTLNKYDANDNLWRRDVDQCCNLRKVIPLEKALNNFDSWISGRKSYHLGNRQKLKAFELINNKIVVNPLFNSSKAFIEDYFYSNNLPRHPLFEQGYLSIGCRQCTQKNKNIEDPRHGRWSDKNKTECGIHLDRRKS